MKPNNYAQFISWATGCLIVGFFCQAGGITITRRSSAVIYTDPTSPLQCSYAAYAISNNTAINYSNVWVKVDSFTGGVVQLAGGDGGLYPLDDLAPGQTKMAFVYLRASAVTATAQTHAVRVYDGYPTFGTQLTNTTFSVTSASPGANNSSKVTTVSYNPTNPAVGGFVTMTVVGDCGQVQNNDTVDFTAASFTNWNAGSFQLVNASIWFTNKNNAITNIANFLQLPSWASPWANGQLSYQASYLFRSLATTLSNTPVSPITLATQGQTETHTSISSYGPFAPIQAPTNTTVLSTLTSVSQLYTNETLTFTARITNSGANDMVMDRVVDTLPPGFVYVAGSARFNAAVILDPFITTNGNVRTLTWSETYTNPAASSRDFTFQAMPTSAGYATNSLVAFAASSQIDTTFTSADDAPALSVVRVLVIPTAAADSGSGLEDTTQVVASPGVLSNDTEPNGFTMSVVSFTQPAHGAVSVNANGGYSYTPVADYAGSDSFTYTLTNGNARTATVTVSLTVTQVNDYPTLAAITNVTINQNSALQTVNFSGISAGPTNENGQSFSLSASSSNPGLIPTPSVSYTSPNSSGVLSFTPGLCSVGQSTISVVVQDSGGTANGGVNTVTNTFVVTVVGFTNSWASGGSLSCSITNAAGSGGSGYTLTNLQANLNIAASSIAPFIINLRSFNGATPGVAANFDYTSAYTWTVATAPCGITGFASNKFVVNNSLFSNDLAGGTFSAGLSSDAKSVQVIFTPNRAPVAHPATYTRAYGTSMRIPLTTFLGNYSSDPDGDTTAIAFAGTSTNGSFIGTNAIYLLYAPTNNLSETFRFTVRDVRAAYRAGDTVLTATNWLTITLSNAVGLAKSATVVGSGIAISFVGVPNYRYIVERASSPAGPWTTLDGSNNNPDSRTNAPSSGQWQFTEIPPQSPAFYRCRQNN